MQCPNCGFENMPGLEACARCNAPLALASATPETFLPPRAGRWKKLRKFTYPLKRYCHVLSPTFRRFLQLTDNNISNGDLCAALLSIVPGLGHLFARRKRAALIATSIWLVLVLLKILFYIETPGGILIGFLVAWHASVIFDAGRFRQSIFRLGGRLMLMLLILAAAALSYRQFLQYTVHRHFAFVRTVASIKSRGITPGDFLLCRRSQVLKSATAGDLLLMAERPRSWRGLGQNVDFPLGHEEIVGTLVARAGEEVVITPEEILVEGLPVDLESLGDSGVSLLLPRKKISIVVPEESIMVIFPLQLNVGYLRGANDVIIARACQILYKTTFIFKESEVVGEPIGVYAPLRNRHFFTQENQEQ